MARGLGSRTVEAAATHAVLSAAVDMEMEVLEATDPRDLHTLSRRLNEMIHVLDRVNRVALQRSDELYRRGMQ